MSVAALSQSSLSVSSFFPTSSLRRISFPEFSFLKKFFQLRNKEVIFQEWNSNPQQFVKELIEGKIAAVTAESYLNQKSETDVQGILDHALTLILKGEYDFAQILNGYPLARTDGKTEELSKKILQSKKGYVLEGRSFTPLNPAASRTRVFANFIPNLMDTFLKAFNLLEAGKKPESIWDYNAMIGIFMSALSFPAVIFGLTLHVTATPAYALIATALFTSAALVGLYAYLRWLRPLPHNLPNCKNIRDIPTPFFANRKETIDTLTQALEAGQNILIVGETGRGKSALVREIGRKLTTKSMQVVNTAVFESQYLSPTDKLGADFDEAEKYPGQVVFFIDEFDKAIQENLVHFLKEKMDLKKFQFIVVCEKAKYEEKIKTLRALDGRLPLKVFLPSPSESELREILLSYYHAEGKEIDCKESAVDIVQHIIAETNLHLKEMQSREQPAAAMGVWEYAIKKMQGADFSQYRSPEALEKTKQIRDLQTQFYWADSLQQEAMVKQIELLQAQHGEIEVKDQQLRDRVKKINRLSHYRIQLRKQMEVFIRSYTEGNGGLTKKWCWANMLQEKLHDAILDEEKHLPSHLKLRLDKAFINSIIKEYTPSSGQESGKSP